MTAIARPVAVTSAPLTPTRRITSRFIFAPSATTPSCNASVATGFNCFGRSTRVASAITMPEPSAIQLGASNATSAIATAVIRIQ
ncbi:MAG: hypothetical protein QM831_39415 [Kofleriaceae bacterium]